MATPFLAQIKLFAGNFPPRGYVFCNGQLLVISQFSAVFALIGTTYGGDGVQTFGLPDLQSRLPVSQGQGPGLPNFTIGQSFGSENVTLSANQMPTHSHTVAANSGVGSVGPAGAVWAATSAELVYGPSGNNALMNPLSVSQAGGNLPHNNIMPVMALNFIFALDGIFPSRN